MHHSTCNFFQEVLKKGLDAKKDHFFSALVFKGLSVYLMTYPLKKWLKDIGIKKDIHYHCTRHTCATLSLALGTDIITIKHILGHKQESTTMRYTKVVNPLMEQAAKRLNISTITQNYEMDKEIKS